MNTPAEESRLQILRDCEAHLERVGSCGGCCYHRPDDDPKCAAVVLAAPTDPVERALAAALLREDGDA